MPVLTALKKSAKARRQREEQGASSSDSDASAAAADNENEAAPAARAKNHPGPRVPPNSASAKKSSTASNGENGNGQIEPADKTNGNSSDNDGQDQENESGGQTIKFVEPLSWVERMSLVALKPLPADVDPEDDPRREEAFVKHALLSVERGVQMLERAKIPWRRPDDYYAEMFKSDVHMDKIRRSIETTKTAVEERMKRRMIKEQKQFGKQVQADVQRQRAQEKKSMMAKVSELRKRKHKIGEDKLDDILGGSDDDESGGARRGGGGGAGNRKGRHHARGAAFRQRSIQPGGKKGGAKRPGKSMRQKHR